jgi:hypothetical protein
VRCECDFKTPFGFSAHQPKPLPAPPIAAPPARNTQNPQNKILPPNFSSKTHLFRFWCAKMLRRAQPRTLIRRILCAKAISFRARLSKTSGLRAPPRPAAKYSASPHPTSPQLFRPRPLRSSKAPPLPSHPPRAPNNAKPRRLQKCAEQTQTRPTTLYFQTKPLTPIFNAETRSNPRRPVKRTHFGRTNPTSPAQTCLRPEKRRTNPLARMAVATLHPRASFVSQSSAC